MGGNKMLYYDKVPSDAECEANEPLNPVALSQRATPRAGVAQRSRDNGFFVRAHISLVCVSYALIGENASLSLHCPYFSLAPSETEIEDEPQPSRRACSCDGEQSHPEKHQLSVPADAFRARSHNHVLRLFCCTAVVAHVLEVNAERNVQKSASVHGVTSYNPKSASGARCRLSPGLA